MVVARWLGSAGLVLAIAGCEGCDGADTGDGDTPVTAAQLLGPLPEDVPQPGAIYQNAYDAALEELTADNAHDRLRQIERQVARERRALR